MAALQSLNCLPFFVQPKFSNARRKQGATVICFSCRQSEFGRTIMKDVKQGAAGLGATFLLSTAVLSSTLMAADSAFALDTAIVQRLFQRSCVGCHVGGGNIIQPGATLTASDLQRNGVSAVDDIYKIVYSGKGRMPGFGEQCAPRGQCTFGPRLSDEEIQSLAEFVRVQADQGWISSH